MWQMQGFFTLQRVRHSPLPSPGQTTGHKKRQRRKARKKHKSQTIHGVENVKRKNNRVWARRHDEETQAENGQVPPGFLAFLGGLGGLGRWDGRDERYVPTSPDHGPEDALCCPRGPCNGRSRRQKSGSYIICAGLLCATASLPFFTAVSFSAPRRALGNIGSSGHRPRCRSIHYCFSLPVCHARRPVLCSSFVPCGFSTPSTTTPTTPPRRVHFHLYLQ